MISEPTGLLFVMLVYKVIGKGFPDPLLHLINKDIRIGVVAKVLRGLLGKKQVVLTCKSFSIQSFLLYVKV